MKALHGTTAKNHGFRFLNELMEMDEYAAQVMRVVTRCLMEKEVKEGKSGTSCSIRDPLRGGGWRIILLARKLA